MSTKTFKFLPIAVVAALLLLGGCGGAPTEEQPAVAQTGDDAEDPVAARNLIVDITSPINAETYNRPDPELAYAVTEGDDNAPVDTSRLRALVHDIVDEERENGRTVDDLGSALRLPVVPDGVHELEFVVNDEDGEPLVTVFVRYITESAPVAEAGIDQAVHPGDPVVLDGSGSYSPVGDPITYAWEIVSKPEGSTAELSDATLVNPVFVADLPGDYQVQLIVTENDGDASQPDTVTISTENTIPVADTDGDQVVTTVGDVVEVDGSTSFDADGDNLTYQWEMTSRPEGSNAEITDPNAPIAVFGVDLEGTYELTLVVTDESGVASDPVTVVVTFFNVAPVAVASTSGSSVMVGDPVFLDGSGSYDENMDPLSYQWNMTSGPTGSQATLESVDTVDTLFVPDLVGTYVTSLTVSDGMKTSAPSNVSVVATSQEQTDAAETLIGALDAINSLEDTEFQNDTLRRALNTKIMTALQAVDQGEFETALEILTLDVLPKLDGCAAADTPDEDDWMVTCVGQGQVYPLLAAVITGLGGTIPERPEEPPPADEPPPNAEEPPLSARELLVSARDAIDGMSDDDFKSPNRRGTFVSKINSAIEEIDEGDLEDAVDKLINDVISKTNGCAEDDEPDGHDWIVNCDAQEQVYPLLADAIIQLGGDPSDAPSKHQGHNHDGGHEGDDDDGKKGKGRR